MNVNLIPINTHHVEHPFQKKMLAVTGDATRFQLLTEVTLVSRQEAASAKVSTALAA